MLGLLAQKLRCCKSPLCVFLLIFELWVSEFYPSLLLVCVAGHSNICCFVPTSGYQIGMTQCQSKYFHQWWLLCFVITRPCWHFLLRSEWSWSWRSGCCGRKSLQWKDSYWNELCCCNCFSGRPEVSVLPMPSFRSSCSLHANSTVLSCYISGPDHDNKSMIPMGGGKRWVSCSFYGKQHLILHLFNSHLVLFFPENS
jgi:hypothetical protein